MRSIISNLNIKSVLKDIPDAVRAEAEYIIDNAQNRKRDQKRYFSALDSLSDYVHIPEARLIVIYAMGPFMEREVDKFLLKNFKDEEYYTLNNLKEEIINELIVWLMEKIQYYDANYKKEGYTGNRMYLITYVERLLKRRIWGHLFHLIKTKKLGYEGLESQTEIYSDSGDIVDSLDYISENTAYEDYVASDVYLVMDSEDSLNDINVVDAIIKYKRKEYGIR